MKADHLPPHPHAPLLFRQGDILLASVSTIPRDARRQAGPGPLILASGESTGHHHAIEDTSAAALYRQGSALLYVEVTGAQAQVRHPEHRPITLPPGFYEVIRQREYNPAGSAPVLD